MEKIHLFYAAMPEAMGEKTLYPTERMAEIENCKSEKTRCEKYWAWVLLRVALKEAFGVDIANLRFTKTVNGKWICDGICFSLSHTDGAVAVAVSHADVGVDIERVRPLTRGIEAKMLTDSELLHYRALKGAEADSYLLFAWCAKEAIFKTKDAPALLPRRIEIAEHSVKGEVISLNGEKYMLTVSPSENLEVKEYKLVL